jgi:repressor LexA
MFNSASNDHRADYLTSTQERILQCIRESIAERGQSPTMQEIGKQLGMRSSSSVHYHLGRIEDLGYIAREPGRPRGIRLT